MKKIHQFLSNIFELLSAGFLLCVAITVVLQVFFRYVARIVVPWTEEAARYFCIWMVFTGAVVAIAQDNHIKITFLIDRIPEKGKHLLVLFSYVVIVLFTIIVFLGSIQLVQLNWGQEAVTFPVSVGVLYLAITVFSGVSLLLMIFLMWNRLKTLFKRAEK